MAQLIAGVGVAVTPSLVFVFSEIAMSNYYGVTFVGAYSVFSVDTNPFELELYSQIYNNYFDYKKSGAHYNCRILFFDKNNGTIIYFGLHMDDMMPSINYLDYSYPYQTKSFVIPYQTKSFVMTKHGKFTTGSASGDFNEILDPKLLLK